MTSGHSRRETDAIAYKGGEVWAGQMPDDFSERLLKRETRLIFAVAVCEDSCDVGRRPRRLGGAMSPGALVNVAAEQHSGRPSGHSARGATAVSERRTAPSTAWPESV